MADEDDNLADASVTGDEAEEKVEGAEGAEVSEEVGTGEEAAV